VIQIALVGTGFIAKVHAESIRKLPNARLAAVVSSDRERGTQFAAKYGATVYPSLDALLAAGGDVDAVDICAPTYLHADMVEAAAAARKHILCEKPIALSLNDADRMIRAVEKNAVKSMIGHTLRFWPEYAKTKEIIDRGDLGKPLSAFCERLAATPDWHKGNWGFDTKKSGGASVDLHIHDLDYLIWIFGDPRVVNARGVYDERLGGFYHINSCIEFAGGTSATAIGGWGFGGSFPFTAAFRVLCEKGSIEWIFRAGKNIEERSHTAKLTIYGQDGKTVEPSVSGEDAYYLECKYFVDCLDQGRNIEIGTLRDSRTALALALAATESARKKKTVTIR
jgi:UDP-N-acetylglucosamine 3-dehydrogenase